MDVLKIFLEEIFDYELEKEAISKYVDAKSNALKLAVILTDPILTTNLIFRFLWKSTTGVYPSKEHAKTFLSKVKLTGDVVLDEFVSYLRVRVPLYNFIPVDMEKLLKAKSMYVETLKTQQGVKEQLAVKFAYRFGIHEDTVNKNESLFNIFRKCIFSKVGYERIQNMNASFSRYLNKEPLEIPEIPETLTDYYEVSSNMIRHYELINVNVFNKYWNPFEVVVYERTTVFDCISHQLSLDANFARTILGSVCLYYDGSESKTFNLETLLTSANGKEGTKNAVVFKPYTYDIPFQTDFYYYTCDVCEPFLLNFVPKLGANYVNISSHLYPQVPIMCTRADNSVYYCLYNSEETQSEKLVTYYQPNNRYLTTDIEAAKKLREIITDKHVYVIAQEEAFDVVYNKEFTEHQWNAHLSSICPFSVQSTDVYHPKFNVLLYDQFLLHYYAENKEKVMKFRPNLKGENVVIMVDNRANIFSVISLYVTFANLDQDQWSAVVVCNKENLAFFKRFLGDKVEYITKFNLPPKKFAIDIYNNMLKDPLFWGAFTKYKKALFVQDDGMLIAPGVEKDFMKYDYVGAPWKREWATQDPNKFIKDNINPQLVGNGGVSLRDVKMMKMICEKYRDLTLSLHYDRIQQQPEDVFFSGCCVQEKLSMPTYEEAQKFSSEQVAFAGAYGFHKTWVYQDLKTIVSLFNFYLKEKLIQS
jgi:hypothetical protein